jgi:ATP-dependent RNA helicase DDX27
LALSRRFKDEQIDILVATDVAARGLDIEGVKTVRLVLILLLVGSLSCVDCSWWGPCASCVCLGHLTDPRSDLQVINFTMPNTVKHYVHRVGRTARAGRAGRSVSLVGEEERKMLKEIVKAAKAPVKARILPQGEQHRMVGSGSSTLPPPESPGQASSPSLGSCVPPRMVMVGSSLSELLRS